MSNIYAKQKELFYVLSHPVRLAILNILKEGEACVCHLEACLGKRQAYLSQQLTVLRQCELVSVRKEGWNVYYRVNNERLFLILDIAEEIVGRAEQADIVQINPQADITCTCPCCKKNTK